MLGIIWMLLYKQKLLKLNTEIFLFFIKVNQLIVNGDHFLLHKINQINAKNIINKLINLERNRIIHNTKLM